ncbi:1-phosphofructokinase family hexose kinase [Planomonospora venezuelensis]|uniref:Tagatose 6-phosphate kinase n=1 Tax=Planomonospora venezuelensis TaxID=1999 RepID=A0A841D605_PLAVE|nr:hexose kinase [Planomonospora venezuelensis]MBB5963934.1 tagatose 6-phosphate kinase [Planomonospora venezuelensis]GIN03882.1 sugar kinase [Planomonospora venezuelensis]
MTSSPPARPATVLTVTLNLALDVTYVTGEVDWDGVNRVRSVHRRAGGKGVNVARVLAALGHDVLVAGLAGGPTGHAVRADLAAAGLPAALTPVDGESRTTLAVSDLGSGLGSGPGGAARRPQRTALFNEPGPVVSAEELGGFLDGFEARLRAGGIAAVVLSGSMPRGVPADFYAALARRAREHGVPAIVDADGEALRHAPAGRPAIVKPNAEELARALAPAEAPHRAGPLTPREVLHGAEALREAGAGAVVVSLGADGLLAVTPGGTWRAALPYRVEGNPTGAGDALVAGLALGLVEGAPWPDRLRRAAALGAAAVAAPVAGEIDREVFRAVLPETRVDAVDP